MKRKKASKIVSILRIYGNESNQELITLLKAYASGECILYNGDYIDDPEFSEPLSHYDTISIDDLPSYLLVPISLRECFKYHQEQGFELVCDNIGDNSVYMKKGLDLILIEDPVPDELKEFNNVIGISSICTVTKAIAEPLQLFSQINGENELVFINHDGVLHTFNICHYDNTKGTVVGCWDTDPHGFSDTYGITTLIKMIKSESVNNYVSIRLSL